MPKHIEALAPIQKLSRAKLLTAGEEKKKITATAVPTLISEPRSTKSASLQHTPSPETLTGFRWRFSTILSLFEQQKQINKYIEKRNTAFMVSHISRQNKENFGFYLSFPPLAFKCTYPSIPCIRLPFCIQKQVERAPTRRIALKSPGSTSCT